MLLFKKRKQDIIVSACIGYRQLVLPGVRNAPETEIPIRTEVIGAIPCDTLDIGDEIYAKIDTLPDPEAKSRELAEYVETRKKERQEKESKRINADISRLRKIVEKGFLPADIKEFWVEHGKLMEALELAGVKRPSWRLKFWR